MDGERVLEFKPVGTRKKGIPRLRCIQDESCEARGVKEVNDG